jgi:hypothetical protein
MKMKRTQRILSIISILSLAVFANCGGDDASTPAQKTELGKLSGTWTVSSVTDDDGARTDFSGMTLTLSGTFNSSTPDGPYNYAVAKPSPFPIPSPWPKPGETDGEWEFSSISSSGGQVLRDPGTADQVAMTYTLSGNTLTLIFNVSGDGWAGGKVSNVTGEWTFVFTK